jgi:hypothetical protein
VIPAWPDHKRSQSVKVRLQQHVTLVAICHQSA